MSFLLDTSTCVQVLRNRTSKSLSRLESTDANGILLCSVVKFELFAGAERCSDPLAEKRKITELFSGFRSLQLDDACAEVAGRIRTTLERQGQKIGAYDLLIAAIALEFGLTVVTRNLNEFKRVPGLQVEDWEAP